MEGGPEGPPSLKYRENTNDRAAFWIGNAELARDSLSSGASPQDPPLTRRSKISSTMRSSS